MLLLNKIIIRQKFLVIKGNVFGLQIKDGQTFPTIGSQESKDFNVSITRTQPPDDADEEEELNVAIVGNRDNSIFFGIPLTLQSVLLPESFGKMTKNMFADEIEQNESKPKPALTIPHSVLNSATDAKEVLRGHNLVFLGTQADKTIFTACAITNERLIIRISILPDGSTNVEALCSNQDVAKVVVKLIVNVIS